MVQNQQVFSSSVKNALASGVVVAASLFIASVLWRDAASSVPTPIPHQYGEGIMTWMSREIDHGRSPYGEILGSPSRYSCYGPVPSVMTAALSRVIPVETEMRYAIAGRSLNLINWVLAGFMLGMISGRITAGLAMACALPLAISHISFMWTFRVDSFVALWESAILLCLTRISPRPRFTVLLAALVCALALTKPPALTDLLPILLVALSLFRGSKIEFIHRAIPPVAVSSIAAVLLLFAVDRLSGGWMLNNIIAEQMVSGWNPGSAIQSNFSAFFLKATMIPILIWAAWGPASSRTPHAPAALTALAISLALCGAASMKSGADVNYYIPALVILAACAAQRLTSAPQSVVFLLALIAFAVPLPQSEAIHRNIGNYPENQKPVSDFLVATHKNDAMLTEDPFFSVLAGKDPLVTDIFQYNIVAHKRGFVPKPLAEKAVAAWGGTRLRDMLSNWSKRSTESPPYPAGIPYMPEAMMYKSPAGLEVSSPPQYKNFPMPWYDYSRKILIPSLVLLLASIFWGPALRSPPRHQKPQVFIS
jgi:hypothetical protein